MNIFGSGESNCKYCKTLYIVFTYCYCYKAWKCFPVFSHVKKKLHNAGISKIEIERPGSRVKINIFSAKPGLVIGKKGKDIEDLLTGNGG